VIESYLKRGGAGFSLYPPEPPQHKTVVQNAFARWCPNPHFFYYRPGRFAVNADRRKVRGRTFSPSASNLAGVNHYLCKSQEDWRLKQERRGGASGKARAEWVWKLIERKCNRVGDDAILRFLPAVKSLMEKYA